MRNGQRVSKERLKHLGIANFYVWMAYTIYDDFLDDEGDPAQLAVANITMRRSWDGYRTVWSNAKSRELVDTIFLGMDAANAWEIANARAAVDGSDITISSLPNYGDMSLLARRAKAHILGPLLVAQNADINEAQYSLIDKGMTQFLIARQLNDDIHDWRKDLQAGHLSPIVAHLLEACRIKPGTYNLEQLVSKIEQYYWQQGLDEVCEMAQRYIARCRKALVKSQLLDMSGPFSPLINRLEEALTAGQNTHHKNKAFLESYKYLERL